MVVLFTAALLVLNVGGVKADLGGVRPADTLPFVKDSLVGVVLLFTQLGVPPSGLLHLLFFRVRGGSL